MAYLLDLPKAKPAIVHITIRYAVVKHWNTLLKHIANIALFGPFKSAVFLPSFWVLIRLAIVLGSF